MKPHWESEIRLRLAGLRLAPTREAAIVEELAQYLEDYYAELLAGGASEAEACEQALAELSGSEMLQRELRRVERQVHQEPVALGTNRRTNMIADLWQDLRFGARMLMKQPGFTLIALLTLAIGIGANTAIFSVVNGVLLRPLPYHDPGRLAMLWTDDTKHGVHEEGTSYPNFADWRSQSRAFADMAICGRGAPLILTGADEPERVMAEDVSANLFPLLGVNPMLGRAFSTDEEEQGARVVVLSYGFWLRRFGGAADLTGKSLEIEGSNWRVIGVMPQGFYFPTKDTPFWLPASLTGRKDRFNDEWRVIGRLKPEATFAQAQAEMTATGRRLAQAYPATDPDFAGFGVNVVPMLDQVTGKNLQLALWVLLGAVTFVLLIACANVANLLLARGATRQREFAIRAALGAGRARIMRQLGAESLLLAAVSGSLGLGLAAAAVRAFVAFAPPDTPRLHEISIDRGVLLFTLGLSLLSGILFGLAPARKAPRSDPNGALRGGSGGASGGLRLRQTRSLLVVGECALAVVLLTGAGLLVRSFLRLQSVNPGFNPEGVLVARVSLPESRTRTSAQTEIFFQQVSERIVKLPGVQAVGAVRDFFFKRNPDLVITVEDLAPASGGPGAGPLTFEYIGPGFFQAIGVPLLRGRLFSEQDGHGPKVAIINETLARHSFHGLDPIGKRFKKGGPQSREDWYTVVGVVGDMRRQELEKQPVSECFFLEQLETMDVVARAGSDPRPLATAVRQAVRSVDQTAAVSSVTTVESRMRELSAQRRLNTWLLAIFAAVALALSGVGIFGVIYYAVSQRRREIGIRIALGAQSSDVLRLIIGQGMKLAVIGVGAGLLTALWLTDVMERLLFEVGARDPATFVGVALSLLGVALLACYLPARRATRVDPMVALRTE
jgi:putative ABC transport system permease protein